MKLWTMPTSYVGSVWPATYVFLTQNRDSDALERSNFQCGLAALKELPEFEEKGDEQTSSIVVRERHWACGWVEWIAIHADDTAAIELCERLEAELEDYPILDESHHSGLEDEEAQQTWANCYNDSERLDYVRANRSQFDFRDYSELIAVVRGKYFNGYASELLN